MSVKLVFKLFKLLVFNRKSLLLMNFYLFDIVFSFSKFIFEELGLTECLVAFVLELFLEKGKTCVLLENSGVVLFLCSELIIDLL